MDRAEGLASCTVGGALLTGEQDVKGVLRPGYYADFAVLSDDFFEIPEERIPEIEALLTVVGGRVVHTAGFFEGLAPAVPSSSRSGVRSCTSAGIRRGTVPFVPG